MLLGHGGGEGDHVVLDLALDLLDAGDVETGVRAQQARGFGGHHAKLGQGFGGRQLHFQPLLELVLVAPDAAHFGAGVSGIMIGSRCQVSGTAKTLELKTSVGCFWLGDDQARGQAAPLQRLLRHHPHDLGMIVVLAQVAQHQRGGRGIEIRAEVSRTRTSFDRWPLRLITRCLTAQGYGPTFSISRSWFDSSSSTSRAAQVELDRFGNVAQIGDHADLDALGAKAEAHGIDGVVRDGEAVDLDIADRQRLAPA